MTSSTTTGRQDSINGKPMDNGFKILFIVRASLYTVRGGDTTQVLKTAEALVKLSVTVNIKLCNEKNIDYCRYNLIHFFNIRHPADMMYHIKKSCLPYVISPIYVDYTKPAKRPIQGFSDRILNLFSADTQEYIKTVSKCFLQNEKIISPGYFWKGHRQSVKWILNNVATLLPNSANEYKRLLASYHVQSNYTLVPNAADPYLFNYTEDDIRMKDNKMVLCVARIELIKNQLNLVKALCNSPFQVYLIGNPAPNHLAYYNECKKNSTANIHFIKEMKQEELVLMYKKAKVHILPSWFETTGLASLEALYCACNIVVTPNGDTREYFDPNHCFYCEPDSTASIRKAVEQAAVAEINTTYIDWVAGKYNWQRTAEITLNAYQQVILNTKQ